MCMYASYEARTNRREGLGFICIWIPRRNDFAGELIHLAVGWMLVQTVLGKYDIYFCILFFEALCRGISCGQQGKGKNFAL